MIDTKAFQTLKRHISGYLYDTGIQELDQTLEDLKRNFRARRVGAEFEQKAWKETKEAFEWFLSEATDQQIKDLVDYVFNFDTDRMSTSPREFVQRIYHHIFIDPTAVKPAPAAPPPSPTPPAAPVDRSTFKETINRKEYEWIEIPAGKFVTGISAEQVKAFQERIRKEQHYDRLSPKEQALLESAIAKAWAWKEKREMLSKEEKAVVRSDYDPSVPAGPGWPIYEVEAILATIPPSQEHSLDTFYITRYPVTFHQFYPFQFQEPHKDPESYSPQEVVWRKDVEAFCTWAGARLPSPLEWEKAGRGAEGFLYPWGNEWDPRRGNFIGESGIRGYPPKELKALGAYVTKVNAYPKGASPYGVMDMAGNLREFTSQKGVAKAYNARRGKKEILWAQHLLSRDTFDESHDIKDGGLCFRLALDHLDPQLWPGFRASKKKKQATKFRIRLWKGAV